jgi:ribonuclease HI
MNEHGEHETQLLGHLRIWQQNCRKSEFTQQCLTNALKPDKFDICLIQEPYLDHLNNTRSSPDWTAVYPPTHYLDNSPRTRSIILISPLIGSDICTVIPIKSPDITAIQIETQRGSVRIFNIYNDQNNNSATDCLQGWIQTPRHYTLPPTPAMSRSTMTFTIWAGDFNRHHPMWDEDHQDGLFTTAALDEAETLIDTVARAGLTMALPKGINTLKTSQGNWTRPDNVFVSHELTDYIVKCDSNVQRTPGGADHLAIDITLDVEVQRQEKTESYLWKDVDWNDLRKELRTELDRMNLPTLIDTIDQLERATLNLDAAITNVVERMVEKVRISRYTRRWWTPELAKLRETVRHLKLLTFRRRDEPQHPVHLQWKTTDNKYKKELLERKREHWRMFVENTREWDIWLLHKTVTGTGSDGGRTRLPSLDTGRQNVEDGEAIYATTNEEKTRILFDEFFPPPAPDDSPLDTPETTPEEVEQFQEITETQVLRAIKHMKPWKAVMKGDIPNALVIHCASILAPHLTTIYGASLRLGHYPSNWKIYDTVVLRKPGRSDYSKANAYRPICLLKTIAKPLSTLITEYLVHLTEKYHLLPNNYFGFRPGRSTADELLTVEKFIRDAWNDGEVVSGLFLDVKGAFPSVHIPQLLIDLKRKGIPDTVTRWIEKKLDGRRTTVVFDGHRSNPLAIRAGLDQGCPLSGLLYSYYNAYIGELVPRYNHRLMIPGFADDLSVLVRGPDFFSTHGTLEHLFSQHRGISYWQHTRNCHFAIPKFALLDFTLRLLQDVTENGKRQPYRGGPIQIGNTVIHPQDSTKCLGVTLHYRLNWTEQWNRTIAKGTKWVAQVARVMKSKMGLQTHLSRRLYLTVCLPKMLYAAEVWAPPQRRRRTIHTNARAPKDAMPDGAIARMARVQRRALIAMTGAMRNTPTDSLEAHMNILPIDLHMDIIRHRAALRIATLPSTHPLYGDMRESIENARTTHTTALMHLHRAYHIDPNRIETVEVVRRPPWWNPAFRTAIARNKEDAIAEDAEHARTEQVRVYSDGSAYQGGVGAGAVLIRTGANGEETATRKLMLHLGSDRHYTVHAAETVGLLLAAHLLRTEPRLPSPTSIGIDNQAAILGCTRYRHGRGQWAVDTFRDRIEELTRETDTQVLVRWTPGHVGIAGNELVDSVAKAAAKGHSSPEHELPDELHDAIPWSHAAIQQKFDEATQRRAKARWTRSVRYNRMKKIDETLPSNTFIKLVKNRPRWQTGLLIRLRTGHAQLNKDLCDIKAVDSAKCDHCSIADETVKHFLIECPAHEHARRRLRAKLGYQKAGSIKFLLTDKTAIPELLRYVDDTGRYLDTLGKVAEHERESQWAREQEENGTGPARILPAHWSAAIMAVAGGVLARSGQPHDRIP